MSLDLDLHPDSHPHASMNGLSDWFLGTTRLMVDRDGWAHCVRESACRKPLPDWVDFEYYFDDGSRKTDVDGHGNKLTWATAEELLNVPLTTPDDDEPVTLDKRTEAALAYLGALPPKTPVVLYFH